MKTTADIRESFLSFFEQNGHKIVPSSSLVPSDDPTLLFANAGMNQFKNVFTGIEKRDYVRAASSQKCVRAGGKHNDLENVGYTARHHTFFEMLGNFSFGDYFKETAIELAWELITKQYGLSKDKLLVTVYSEDEEAASIWKKVAGLNDSKIIRIPTSDNFWSMGETGPCGPCSEIFYDHGEDIPGGPPGSPDEDGDRFIEIWNLVFMQYDQVAKANNVIERVNLPKPSIDTGMGLERITAVLQGVHNNYEIDLFKNIINEIAEHSGQKPEGHNLTSQRVIADHLRSCGFLIADGVTASNEGRGYVLRRIMRRAMRHAHILGCKDPLMWKLVPILVQEMGQSYPELLRAQSLITESFLIEEERFKQTLDRGLKLLEAEVSKLSASQPLPGQVAFKLYDTYGFPLDLTQDILRAEGRQVDLVDFETEMERQKQAARAAWTGASGSTSEAIWFDIHQKYGSTEFLGYETTDAEGQVQTIIKDGQEVKSASKGDEIIFVVNQTPFYGESGGQIGDTGTASGNNCKLEITNTLKKNAEIHAHVSKVIDGTINVGDILNLNVDKNRRTELRSNHSVTHLLHAALRNIIGDQLTQKGSLVAPDRLRFDFSNNSALTKEQLNKAELEVNAQIRANLPVITHIMSTEEAQKSGAMALFGEKYGDEVRVVSMGENNKIFSTELCGGTHVNRTGDIGYFKIISESGIAAGIRRIEAVTGRAAEDYSNQRVNILDEVSNLIKAKPEDLAEKIESLMTERKNLEKQLQLAKQTAMFGNKNDDNVETINGISFVNKNLEDADPKGLKPTVDKIKNDIGTGVCVVTSVKDGKVSVVVGVTNDLINRFNAIDLVNQIAMNIGGKGGGGRPDIAQAGGTEPSAIPNAIDNIREKIKNTA